MITSECIVVEDVKEKKDGGSKMPMGGMGGMGDMY
jgi:hypothetical protein